MSDSSTKIVSTKETERWTKHYVSKAEFPTRIIKNGQFEGTLSIGHARAKPVVEKELGRPLKAKFKVITRGGCWVFLEPKE